MPHSQPKHVTLSLPRSASNPGSDTSEPPCYGDSSYQGRAGQLQKAVSPPAKYWTLLDVWDHQHFPVEVARRSCNEGGHQGIEACRASSVRRRGSSPESTCCPTGSRTACRTCLIVHIRVLGGTRAIGRVDGSPVSPACALRVSKLQQRLDESARGRCEASHNAEGIAPTWLIVGLRLSSRRGL